MKINKLKHLGRDLSVSKLMVDDTFATIDEYDLVYQDLQLLICTRIGERVMRPKFGCRLPSRIWDNIDDVSSAGPSDIYEVVDLEESRVRIIDVKSIIDRATGLVWMSVTFEVKKDSSVHNLVYPFKIKQNV